MSYRTLNGEVRGKFLQRLEEMYDYALNTQSVAAVCWNKWNSARYSPFEAEVEGSVVHSINTMSGFFVQYLVKEYLRSMKYKGKPRYEILPECDDKGFSLVNFNVMKMNTEVHNRNVDLLFRDNLDGQVYYVKICKRNHFTGDARDMFVASYNQMANALAQKYDGLHAYILFMEEFEVKHFGIVPPRELITGREFFKKFFNMPITEYFNLIEEGKRIVDADKQYERMRKTIGKFVKFANQYGDDAAYDMLTQKVKSVGSTKIAI